MAEALWVQAAGVDYSAAEDRRLISSIWTPGVLYGLKVSAGAGLSAVVSPGRCVISDGVGGCYLAQFDTATTVSSLSASATNTLYVTVDPTTAQATIVKGAAPTSPYLQIGGATTSTTAVTGVSNVRATAASPADTPPATITAATIAPPSPWTVASTEPWRVERSGNTVFSGGRLTHASGTMVAGDVALFNSATLIPLGYRPTRQKSITCLSDVGGVVVAQIIVRPDGTAVLHLNYSNLGAGETVRLGDVSWLTQDA